jgi:hypothetical protein
MALTYEPIATVNITATGTSTISFTSIPQTYTDLRISLNGIVNGAGGVPLLRFNSDTGANYCVIELYGAGSTPGAYTWAASSTPYVGGYGAFSTTTPSMATIDIMNYTSTVMNKGSITQVAQTYPTGPSGYVIHSSILWTSSSAITSIQLATNVTGWGATAKATLFGIKAA